MREFVAFITICTLTLVGAVAIQPPARSIEPYYIATDSDSAHLRIAFWNLENAFDTINAPGAMDNEFTPTGSQKWNIQKYLHKTEKIRQTIINLNPSIIGICEVENQEVIIDILPPGFRFVHYDSPDPRGIDVALIYNPAKIKISNSEPIRAAGTKLTRDILRVDATIIESPPPQSPNAPTTERSITIFVVHLPSKRGNDPAATQQRKAISRQLDSISALAPATIVMGDMNQNPSKELFPRLYNTTTQAYKQGKGSYAYRDAWQMYDQIFIKGINSSTVTTHARVYTQGLIQQNGRFRGYPAKGDPSDHLPVYIDIDSKLEFTY